MRRFALAPAATLLLAPLACDHDHADDHDHAQHVAVRFAAVVGAEPFACSKTFDVGGVEVAPLDFRLYVHDLQLVDAAGELAVTLEADGLWQNDAVALLDFEDKSGTCTNGTTEVNDTVHGDADTGHEAVDFVGIEFSVGVPFALNHGDVATAASPLNLSGLLEQTLTLLSL